MRAMILPRSTLLVLALLVAGCSPHPRVRSTATAGADFSRYHTYAIRPGNVVYPGAPEAQRQAIAQRIQDAIAAELEGRGMTPQPEQPDLVVTYTAGAQQSGGAGAAGVRAAEGVDVRGPSGYDEPGLVRPREWDDAAADLESRRRYNQGNLIIDLLDGKTRRLIWRATTTDLELASDRGAKMIDQVVHRAFTDVTLGGPDAGGRSATTQTVTTTTAPAAD